MRTVIMIGEVPFPSSIYDCASVYSCRWNTSSSFSRYSSPLALLFKVLCRSNCYANVFTQPANNFHHASYIIHSEKMLVGIDVMQLLQRSSNGSKRVERARDATLIDAE